ncbi:GIY-YIG nuclease family protein [Leptolyngbya sp. AN02str]|uniref:GIY-YIG nuclease family protein n=1 Tax=Leptolyngbya sp. AN02str TaxID=3423363 RepID=UPI003D314842
MVNPTLAELSFMPYLDEAGHITATHAGKIGVYAIYNEAQALQFVGYSRDIYVSLKEHLVRRPTQCYWLKVHTIDRPNRTVLEEIRHDWLAEQNAVPPGNADDATAWTQAIDATQSMTPEEHAAYAASDEVGKIKTLKQVARRIEAEILGILQERGVQTPLRFDPKLKEEGKLSLKP